MRRGQLSLSVVEAAIGVLLVVGVAAGFAVGVADAPSAEPRLDALARDVTDVLGSGSTAREEDARLVALTRSRESFARVRASTRERVASLLPADVAFRIRTPRGTIGLPRPPTTAVGTATVPTRHGPVTVRVWYG